MKPKTRLSSVVFQLTPTRTRCDLIIIANDKKEKIASGLLDPFLAHLKTAQDQIAKGGYSILLEPEAGSDAPWFTKSTLERFVRFVSTPEILERVYTIETEILQIEEAIALQSSNDIGKSTVENIQQKSPGGHEGDKSATNSNDEKAIVLYTPGSRSPEANGSCLQEDNSKVQLLKVLETRKSALQKEQGMAFARAVAAGFDIDHMEPLVSFAECFGAMRFMEACSKFRDLWNRKQETGQWLDIEASETLYTQPDFSMMKASGVAVPCTPIKQDDSEHNPKQGSANNADNPVSSGQQEYFQGQFPHLVFPSWPMHASPGAQPVFQAYPVQGMPYYQTYSGNGPFVQPHQYPLEHSPSNFSPHSGQKRQSHDVRDSNDGSETREIDRTNSLDDTASETEVSYSRKPRKKVGKKKSGMVVIRNINYITSKEKKSGSETNSESHSDIDTENEYLEGDGKDEIHQSRSSKSVGKLNFNNDEVSIFGKETDDRHWQAFQDCLLRGNDEDAVENGVKIKRRANTSRDDSLTLHAQDRSEMQGNSMKDIHRMSGSTSRMPRSGEEVLFSGADNGYRGSSDQSDIQFAETSGRKMLYRSAHDDFIVGSRQSPGDFRNPTDPLDVNSFQGGTSKKDGDSSPGMADESLIVPFRSISLDQYGATDRTAIDIDSEIPSKYQKSGSEGNKNRVNYEPNDLSLMPERGTDGRSIEYNPALDYEMQVCAEVSEKKGGKDVANAKGGLKKPDKDRRSTLTLQKQRTGGPIRKGNPSKISPLEDARARAEKLRSYKADLLKMKKEQEAAEAKRLEALKLQRQKRIAARGGTTSGKPATVSPKTKQLPAKLSPATNRGSKFSDSEPGSSSPLQRSKLRTSLGSSEANKASKASKLSDGSHTAGNRLTRSSSSLSEKKREPTGVTPESKASLSRIRRLSEPKAITNSPVITMKAQSAEAVLKRKKSDGPDKSKVSSIINLDRSKAATLPELKIKTPKSRVNTGENISAVKDEQKVNGTRPSMLPESAHLNAKNGSGTHQVDTDENPIVEKIVVVESGKPSLPTLHSSEGKPKVWNQLNNDRNIGEKSNLIHAPDTPVDVVVREPIQKQSDYNEVKNAYSEKDDEQSYRAPYARVSSMEDPSTRQSEYGKSPLASSEMLSIAEETVKAHVPNVKALETGKKQITPEKTSVKESSSKGLRRLLKFGGKKNHASSSVDQSVDSECAGEQDDSARKLASTGEVHTLKNLILQDETPTDGSTPQKTSRHFSLLLPFRLKTSEKKQAS